MRSVVVLPAPFGPRNPVTSPGRTVKDRSSTARMRAERLREVADRRDHVPTLSRVAPRMTWADGWVRWVENPTRGWRRSAARGGDLREWHGRGGLPRVDGRGRVYLLSAPWVARSSCPRTRAGRRASATGRCTRPALAFAVRCAVAGTTGNCAVARVRHGGRAGSPRTGCVRRAPDRAVPRGLARAVPVPAVAGGGADGDRAPAGSSAVSLASTCRAGTAFGIAAGLGLVGVLRGGAEPAGHDQAAGRGDRRARGGRGGAGRAAAAWRGRSTTCWRTRCPRRSCIWRARGCCWNAGGDPRPGAGPGRRRRATWPAPGLEETKRAVAALRGERRPLADELARLAEEFRATTGNPCAVEMSGDPATLPPQARLAVVRTAQEALTNVHKHAPRRRGHRRAARCRRPLRAGRARHRRRAGRRWPAPAAATGWSACGSGPSWSAATLSRRPVTAPGSGCCCGCRRDRAGDGGRRPDGGARGLVLILGLLPDVEVVGAGCGR